MLGSKKAKKLANENGVHIETILADLATFDLGKRKWDGIVSIWCHLPPVLRKDLHKRIEPALKPSGVFFLEGYRPDQLKYRTGGPPVAEMMISKETLRKELSDLSFSHLQELDREVREGINHQGMGAVIQAIGTPHEK